MAELRDGMTLEEWQTYNAFQADLAMLEMAPRLIRELESDDEAQAQAEIARAIIRRHAPRLNPWGLSIASATMGRAIGRPIARFVENLAKRLG